MAIVCPQCGEIHFDTNSTPQTHCRKCNSDLNEVSGLVQLSLPSSPAPYQTRMGRKVILGVVVLVLAGVMWWWGGVRFTSAKKVEATVVPLESQSYGGNGPKPGQIRHPHTATYTIQGKKYYQYPGVRQIGDKFTVYYLPDEPDSAQEEPPFAFLIAAGVLTKLGLLLLIRGLFQFSVSRAREADYRRTMGTSYSAD